MDTVRQKIQRKLASNAGRRGKPLSPWLEGPNRPRRNANPRVRLHLGNSWSCTVWEGRSREASLSRLLLWDGRAGASVPMLRCFYVFYGKAFRTDPSVDAV